MSITEAPHGINLVVETGTRVYFGRFEQAEGDEVKLCNASYDDVCVGPLREKMIRERARFGVPPDFKDLTFQRMEVVGWRRLGDVPKE